MCTFFIMEERLIGIIFPICCVKVCVFYFPLFCSDVTTMTKMLHFGPGLYRLCSVRYTHACVCTCPHVLVYYLIHPDLNRLNYTGAHWKRLSIELDWLKCFYWNVFNDSTYLVGLDQVHVSSGKMTNSYEYFAGFAYYFGIRFAKIKKLQWLLFDYCSIWVVTMENS